VRSARTLAKDCRHWLALPAADEYKSVSERKSCPQAARAPHRGPARRAISLCRPISSARKPRFARLAQARSRNAPGRRLKQEEKRGGKRKHVEFLSAIAEESLLCPHSSLDIAVRGRLRKKPASTVPARGKKTETPGLSRARALRESCVRSPFSCFQAGGRVAFCSSPCAKPGESGFFRRG